MFWFPVTIAYFFFKSTHSLSSYPLNVGLYYPGTCNLSVRSIIDSPHKSIRRIVDVSCSFSTETPTSCVRVLMKLDNAEYTSRSSTTCPADLLKIVFYQVEDFLCLRNIKQIVLKDGSFSMLRNTNVIIPTVLFNSLMIDTPFSVFCPPSNRLSTTRTSGSETRY